MAEECFSVREGNLDNFYPLGFRDEQKEFLKMTNNMNFQCEEESSKDLDLIQIREVLSSIYGHINFGDNPIEKVKIVEREDIVLTGELIRCAHLQKEPIGLNVEYLSDDEFQSLIKDYV